MKKTSVPNTTETRPDFLLPMLQRVELNDRIAAGMEKDGYDEEEINDFLAFIDED